MPDDDVELKVRISGGDQAKRELQDIARAAEGVKGSDGAVGVDTKEQQQGNDQLSQTAAHLSTVGTLLGVDRRNVSLLTKAFRALADGSDAFYQSLVSVAGAFGRVLTAMTHPIFIGFAAILFGIVAALKSLKDAAEKLVEAYQRVNAEMQKTIELREKLKQSEDDAVDVLAETEKALRAGGAQPTAKQTKATALGAQEAAARTGQDVSQFIKLAAATGETNPDRLIALLGASELPEDSALRAKGLRQFGELKATIDAPEKAKGAAARQFGRNLNARQQALELELENTGGLLGEGGLVPAFAEGIRTATSTRRGAGLDAIDEVGDQAKFAVQRRKQIREQLEQINKQRALLDSGQTPVYNNSIIFNAPDARRSQKSTSQIGVP